MGVMGKIMSPSLASKPMSLIKHSRGLWMGTGCAGGAPELGPSPTLLVYIAEVVELGSSTAVAAAAAASSPLWSSISSPSTSALSFPLASRSLC